MAEKKSVEGIEDICVSLTSSNKFSGDMTKTVFATGSRGMLREASEILGEGFGILTTSAFVKRHRLKSASSVQSASKQLLEMDISTKVGNEYTPSDSLLKLWLTREIQ